MVILSEEYRRLKAIEDAAREFFIMYWLVEHGVANYNLRNGAVEFAEKARERLRKALCIDLNELLHWFVELDKQDGIYLPDPVPDEERQKRRAALKELRMVSEELGLYDEDDDDDLANVDHGSWIPNTGDDT